MANPTSSGRGLEAAFMRALSTGVLAPFRQAVMDDNTLILELRNGYVDIYYRGGRLIEILQRGGVFTTDFDPDYCSTDAHRESVARLLQRRTLESPIHVQHWIDALPLLKHIVDLHTTRSNKLEKEFQQLVVRENNLLRGANDTDYFIIDFEYVNPAVPEARFDLVALRWDATSRDRRLPEQCRIALIEMKYGDGALEGNAGVEKHLRDAGNFLNNEAAYQDFVTEMLGVFSQKRELGLIRFGVEGNTNQVTAITGKPEFIFLFAAHKPGRKKLAELVHGVVPLQKADLKFATASFMGYSLYARYMLDHAAFLRRLAQDD